MRILGISCYYHDAAAALIVDGQLIAAAEEERFTRKKHDSGFPIHAITFCLTRGHCRPNDLDYIVFYEKPFLKFSRILMSILQTFPLSYRAFREAMATWLGDKLWIKETISRILGLEDTRKILFSLHHASHAASAFFCSPFEKAAILTVDGVGEWATMAMGVGEGTTVRLLREIHFPHSLGLLYSAFTAFLGFEVNEGEYKVMGMAPYGRPIYVDRIWRLVTLLDDGSFWLDTDYFSFHHSITRTFNGRFKEIFGAPREPQASETIDPYYADIAASIQAVTETVLIRITNLLYRETGLSRLCMAGGVALNSVANWKILRETPFEEIYIQPAAGDSGGAIGAALYVYHTLLGYPRSFVMDRSGWGKEYTAADIRDVLDQSGLFYLEIEDQKTLIDRVVEELVDGKVAGWFQGRFEWGPRALGHRSILADPRRGEMKEVVNRKIKFREPFRPFAPSVVAERADGFFDLQGTDNHYPPRFMLYVVPVKEAVRSLIPAVTHVDGSGRLQIVHRETEPLYYTLIERFGEATGVPVLLNTSFNLRGEPIVNAPEDAVSTFLRSEMDCLAIGPFLCKKIGS